MLKGDGSLCDMARRGLNSGPRSCSMPTFAVRRRLWHPICTSFQPPRPTHSKLVFWLDRQICTIRSRDHSFSPGRGTNQRIMATLYPTDHASASTLRQQHERLNSLLEAIKNRLSRERKPSRNLMSLLNALAVHLQTHFELEESDGYLSNLVKVSPALSPAVDRVLRGHNDLLAEVTDLVTLARRDFAINHDTADLAHRFSKFQTRLQAHEHEKNALIQEAYNLDLGTKD